MLHSSKTASMLRVPGVTHDLSCAPGLSHNELPRRPRHSGTPAFKLSSPSAMGLCNANHPPRFSQRQPDNLAAQLLVLASLPPRREVINGLRKLRPPCKATTPSSTSLRHPEPASKRRQSCFKAFCDQLRMPSRAFTAQSPSSFPVWSETTLCRHRTWHKGIFFSAQVKPAPAKPGCVEEAG